jgi:hypothetical protein
MRIGIVLMIISFVIAAVIMVYAML